MTDLLIKKQEIEARKTALENLRVPTIPKRDLLRGMATRPRRLEIKRYKREILRQKQAYERQLIEINTYLKSLNNGNGISATAYTKPPTTIFDVPKLRKVRFRRRWI